MLMSMKWLNRHLSPGDVTPEEAEDVLTQCGFPIEGREDVSEGEGDVVLDVELTSNRGDCFAHFGLAREVAAVTGRGLVDPTKLDATTTKESPFRGIDNRVASMDACPRFTARLIRGVNVGPSPEWMQQALKAIGLRPINCVVDISNYVLFELGHPNHVFDFGHIKGGGLVIRNAEEGETVTGLDEIEHTLKSSDLVVADHERAVSIAGVIGGLETGVTEKTTDVLVEVATWHPIAVRNTGRRLNITTDALYRFERFVDPRDLERANDRVCQLILELAGGELAGEMADEGVDPAPLNTIDLRAARCEHKLGITVPTDEMVSRLSAVGFGVETKGEGLDAVLTCTVPPHRHDVTREIDLIEEVLRLHGMDNVPVAPTVEVKLDIAHPTEWANREKALSILGTTLTGAGFYETVTFSFVPKKEADPFLPDGIRLLKVDEERRKGAPYLRPSVIPSLLTCRKANQDGQVTRDGGVRLFELADVFGEIDDGDQYKRQTIENRNLTLLIDSSRKVEGKQAAIRTLRGAIESLARALGGADATVDVTPHDPVCEAWEAGAFGSVSINGNHVGVIGAIEEKVSKAWDLDTPVAGAEINLPALIALYPPANRAHTLPTYPAIERDLSLLVPEDVAWKSIESIIDASNMEKLEDASFVGVFRGKQAGEGVKSVTFRLTFRDEERTLRHEEVDPQVESLVTRLVQEFGAEMRA